MTTPKLKLHSLSDDRPSPYPIRTLIVFRQFDCDNLASHPSAHSSDSDYIQKKASNDNRRLYVDANDAAKFLNDHNLLKLPEKPNPAREAYTAAKGAWQRACISYLAPGHTYYAIKKLFISHELLKAGYTISDTLYDQYC